MRKTYPGTQSKSNRKFAVIGNRELLVPVPLPRAEVWEELQAPVEQLTGQAGRRVIGTILEDEVTRRVGPLRLPLATPARRLGGGATMAKLSPSRELSTARGGLTGRRMR